MKRVILLVLVFILILGFSLISFATDSINEMTPGNALKSIGLLQGDGTSLGEQEELTREELITILVRMDPSGEFTNFDYTGNSGFVDVPNDHWAAKYIAFSKEHDITNGIGDEKFGLGQKVTGRDSLIFFSKLLGAKNAGKYYDKKDWELSGILKSELGLELNAIGTESIDSNLKRKDIFALMVDALKNKSIGSDITLGDKLGKSLNDVKLDYTRDYVYSNVKEILDISEDELASYTDFNSFKSANAASVTVSREIAKKIKILQDSDYSIITREAIQQFIASKDIEYISYESNDTLYDDYRRGYTYITSNISLNLATLLEEGHTNFDVNSTEGMAGGNIDYNKAYEVGDHYFIFITDSYKSKTQPYLIIIEKMKQGVQIYSILSYGEGITFKK